MKKLSTVFEELVKQMQGETKTNKKSYVAYVYGQIYAEYLKSGRQKFVMIENIHAREWKNILKWLKEKGHIEDYALGDTVETACNVVVKGFNEENKIYKKYLEGIRMKIAKAA